MNFLLCHLQLQLGVRFLKSLGFALHFQVSVTGRCFGSVEPVCSAGQRRHMAVEEWRDLHQPESGGRV